MRRDWRPLVLALLAACSGAPEGSRAAPALIQVVAVLPLSDLTARAGFDPEACAELLASELVGRGFRVVRPAQLRAQAASGETVRTAADAVRVGRRAGADAVLACAVTDYDPYDPPRVAILTQFLSVAPAGRSDDAVDRLLRSGSWNRGPLAISPGSGVHALAAFEGIYDSRDRETRRRLEAYIQAHQGADTGISGLREFLAVQSRYFRFVSHEILDHTFEIARPHGT